MKTTILLILLAVISGCSDPAPPEKDISTQRDQCLRQKIFMQCLASLPKGPSAVGENGDWAGVVDSCENAAFYQSLRPANAIPAGCAVN